MEKNLKEPLFSDFVLTLKRLKGRRVTCTLILHLFFSMTCLTFFFCSTDATHTSSLNRKGRVYFGVGLRTRNNTHVLMVADGPQSVHSCHDFCCQSQSCNVFWLLEDTCILADCRTPNLCQTAKMDSKDSLLVFLKKESKSRTLPFRHISNIVSRDEYPPKESHKSRLKRALSRVKRQDGESKESKGEKGKLLSEQNQQSSGAFKNVKNNTGGSKETEPHTSSLIPTTSPLPESPTTRSSAIINTTELRLSGAIQDTGGENPDMVTLPFLVTGNMSAHTNPVPTTTSTIEPVTNKLVVSAGPSVEVTLPNNAVQLNAFVVPEPPEGKVYTYDWRLITHPTDYSGEMEGKHTQSLKLSKRAPKE